MTIRPVEIRKSNRTRYEKKNALGKVWEHVVWIQVEKLQAAGMNAIDSRTTIAKHGELGLDLHNAQQVRQRVDSVVDLATRHVEVMALEVSYRLGYQRDEGVQVIPIATERES